MPNPWDSLPDAEGSEPKGEAKPWDSLPDAGANDQKPKPQGVWDRLMEYKRKKDKELSERSTGKIIQDALTMAGNVPIATGGVAGSAIAMLRRGLSDTPSTPLPVEAAIPSFSLAGNVKGVTDIPVGAAQLASHLTGVRTPSVDRTAQAIKDYYTKNYDPSVTGEMMGQTAALGPGGTGARGASRLMQLLNEGKNLALPAVITPETELKDGDFAGRKGTEIAVNTILRGGTKAASGAARLVGKVKSRLGNAPSIDEIQAKLSEKFGDRTPGQALKDAILKSYEEPLGRESAIYKELIPEAKGINTDYASTKAALDRIVEDYNSNVSQMRPDQIEQIMALRDRIAKATAPEGSEVSNDLAGLIRAYQDLGKPLGNNINNHGNTLSRGVLQDIRSALLEDAATASEGLGGKWEEARKIRREEIVPQFDPKQGGAILRRIRDFAGSEEDLRKLAQGGLRDVNVPRLQTVAKYGGSEPLLWQVIENAKTQANGRPGSFAGQINKAQGGVDAIADPEMAQKIRDMGFTARASQVGGVGVNALILSALNSVPGLGPGLELAYLAGSHATPALTGTGLTWKAAQNPKVRQILSKSWNIPIGTPEFDARLAQYLSLQADAAQGKQ